MKTYEVTVEKTYSLSVLSDESVEERVHRLERFANCPVKINIKNIREQPKCRYLSFTELLELYNEPDSPIDSIEANILDGKIYSFTIWFKNEMDKSVNLYVKNLCKDITEDEDVHPWLKVEVD
jgi:hypothetical protein